MAGKAARCRPALSCLNTHKVARQNVTGIKRRAPKLIKKPKAPEKAEKKEAMEPQVVNQTDIKILAAWNSSIGLLGHLYTVLPPAETALVEEVLIRLLLIKDSTIRSKVTDCARRQLRSPNNNIYYRIDWTGLDIPAHICEAVWQFHCMDKLLHD